jgi:uncharacterized protein (DUF2249 family)
MADKIVTLDVREDIRGGREPFSRIMTAIAGLDDGQELVLIAPFEPLPLFGVLAKKGFQYTSREVTQGHWEILFSRAVNSGSSPKMKSELNPRTNPAASAASIVDVDARGLEPPQPMIKILEALATLPDGAQVRAHTDRRPIHLYSHLEERGFVGESQEQGDGSFITHIRPGC